MPRPRTTPTPPRRGRPRVGSVTEHKTPDGRHDHWIVRVTFPDGTRSAPIHLKPGTSEAMARENAKAWTEAAARGELRRESDGPPPKTIAEIVPRWVALVASSELAPSTKAGHRQHAAILAERFGDLAPTALDAPRLRPWVRELRAANSPSRTRNIFNSLGKMLEDARAEGWTDAPNGCRLSEVRAELPAVEAPEDDDKARHSEAEAARLVFDARVPIERRLRYLLAFTTGMRDGELAGLRWSSTVAEHDVPALKVKDQIARYGDEGWATRRATKTRAGRRTIPLHPAAVAALDAWRESGWRTFVGRAPTDADPILPSPEGEAWRPRSSDLLREDLATVGLPDAWGQGAEPFEFRSTRRSFASWLEAHDVPGDHADRLLGHAGASVRRRHYSAGDLAALARAVATIRLEPPSLTTPDAPEGGGFRGPTFGRILADAPRALPRRTAASPRSLSNGGARHAGAVPGLQSLTLPRVAAILRGKPHESDGEDDATKRAKCAKSRRPADNLPKVDPPPELLALSLGVSSLASFSVLEAEIARLDGPDATTSAGGAS